MPSKTIKTLEPANAAHRVGTREAAGLLYVPFAAEIRRISDADGQGSNVGSTMCFPKVHLILPHV